MITITIKCSNAEKAEVESEATATVADFKVLVAEKLNTPPENQRLIYKGRILKDESTLEQYDIQGNLYFKSCILITWLQRWSHNTFGQEWHAEIVTRRSFPARQHRRYLELFSYEIVY